MKPATQVREIVSSGEMKKGTFGISIDDAAARKEARCTVGDLFGAAGELPPNVKVKLQKVVSGQPPKGLRFP
jgi:hypothetical protein